jgi:hypothetical protein
MAASLAGRTLANSPRACFKASAVNATRSRVGHLIVADDR